ncbi:hypothetical protein ACOZDE_19015 [Streptomyces griseoincarnatus]
MHPLAVSDPVALGLVGVLVSPLAFVAVYFCTRRAVRAWRRWAS